MVMNNDEKHTVIILVGKTCSGKSSLAKMLCERCGYNQLISQTTRPKRNENDNDHTFVNIEDYENAKSSGNIVAETEIGGNYYYSTFSQLYDADIYTVNPEAIPTLLSMNLPDIRFVIIYISCSDEERKNRSKKRGDDKLKYRSREVAEHRQFRQFVANEQWDYSIKNQDINNTYSVLKWICEVEGVWKNHMDETKE